MTNSGQGHVIANQQNAVLYLMQFQNAVGELLCLYQTPCSIYSCPGAATTASTVTSAAGYKWQAATSSGSFEISWPMLPSISQTDALVCQNEQIAASFMPLMMGFK
jgi:hypothetical protein